eukprot:augustus_masked-scaffold_57-processed-gene-1.64-mRNA-1 protein AED:1.00 eAED:1.00 QI:0/0/0/0/1/1/9/0/1857
MMNVSSKIETGYTDRIGEEALIELLNEVRRKVPSSFSLSKEAIRSKVRNFEDPLRSVGMLQTLLEAQRQFALDRGVDASNGQVPESGSKIKERKPRTPLVSKIGTLINVLRKDDERKLKSVEGNNLKTLPVQEFINRAFSHQMQSPGGKSNYQTPRGMTSLKYSMIVKARMMMGGKESPNDSRPQSGFWESKALALAAPPRKKELDQLKALVPEDHDLMIEGTEEYPTLAVYVGEVSQFRNFDEGYEICNTSGNVIGDAKFDSGAEVTVWSWWKHKDLLDSYSSADGRVHVANDAPVKILAAGYVGLLVKVNGVESRACPRAKVVLVQSQDWPSFLIGRSELRRMGLDPAQNLGLGQRIGSQVDHLVGQLQKTKAQECAIGTPWCGRGARSATCQKTSMNLDGYFEVRFIEARQSHCESLTESKRLSNEDARRCSTAVLYSAWDGVLDDGQGEGPKSFNIGSSAIHIPPTRIYSSVGNLDLVERINSGNFEGIDVGKIIKSRRHEPMIKQAIHEMIDRSEASEEMRISLRKLCLKYWDVFATDHTQTKISGLTPMPVYPLEVFDFSYPRVRPMSAEKPNFIRDKLVSMADRGLVTKVKFAEFVSVVFAVPKKGNKLRMVVDLVDVNKILRRDANELPHLEACFDNLAGSKYYGSFDVVSGFDQLDITEEAKKYFNIVSEHGTFQLQFAAMGYHSTPVFFHQRRVDEVVGEILVNRPRNGVIQWIDDSLLYADDFGEYLKLSGILLMNLRKAKVRISPAKSIILAKEIVYYGQLHHIKGENNVFADMLSCWAATPEREKQRVASIRIMRAAIRRDRKESDVSLGPQLSLTSKERKYYRRIFKHPLEIDEGLSRWTGLRDKYTDSDSVSSDLGFSNPWYENEGISHGLRPDDGLEIKIERPSLEEEYSRLALVDTESAVSLEEIGTWVSSQMIKSEISSNEEIKIEVPRGGLDVLVSELRLSPKKKEKPTFERMRALDKDRISCLNPYYQGEWKRISEKELLDAQKRESLGDGLKISEEEGRIIVPQSLFERQLVHIHLANRHGSRIQDVAEVRRFNWKIPSSYGSKVSTKIVMLGLRSNCTHCNSAPKLVKTNLRLVTEARRPKDVLVADFLYVNTKGYILVITDVFSRFCFLYHAPKADAGIVVRTLSKFHTYWRLESEFTLVTDRASHFANSLSELLQKEVRFTHNYAVSYASWTNGEVEIVHRKSVMTAVNEVPLPSRKLPGMKDAPSANLLFLNTDPTREYIETEAFPKVIYRKIGDRQGAIRVDKDILYRLSMEFRREPDEMHSQVADYVSLMKRRRNEYWNKRQKRVDKACIQYVPGDWCLISTKNTPREGNKIKLIWSGPPLLTMYRDVKELTLKFFGEKRISNRKKLVRKQAQAWLDRKFAIDVSAAWVGRLHPSLLHYLRDKEDLSVWGKPPGRQDFVLGWKTFDHKLIRNLILKFGMGNFEQFTRYMPYKSKAMMGQFIDIDKGEETSERFSLDKLEFDRRFDSLGSAKSFLMETCPEGVSQTYRISFERKKKEVETMVKICEDRFIKLYKSRVSRAGMKCSYLLCSLELSRKRYLHEVLDKDYPKELVSKIEGILVAPVECELSGGSPVIGFEHVQTLTLKRLCGNLCLVGFEGSSFWTRICVPPRDKLWFTADLYKSTILTEWPGDKVDLLLMDPPWVIGQANPIRGLRVPYARKPDSQVLNLNFETLKASFIAIWVIDRTWELTLNEMFDRGYELLHVIEWVKLAPSGKIRTSLGYYYQHSAEALLIFVRKMERLVTSVVEKIELLRKEKVIFADRLIEGVKPRKTYELFEKIFLKRHLKVDLFARCANLKSGWIQIGLEVDPRIFDLVFGCYRPGKTLAEKTSE